MSRRWRLFGLKRILKKIAVAIPTDGLIWSSWLPEFIPESVNSGVGLEFIGGNSDYAEFTVISLNGDFKITFTGGISNFIKFISGSNSFIESRGTNQYSLSIPTRMVMTIMDQEGDVISLGREGADLYAELNGVEVDRLVGQATAQVCNFQYLGRDFAGTFFNSKLFNVKFEGGGLASPITYNIMEGGGTDLYPLEHEITGVSATIYGADWLTGRSEGDQLYNWGVNKIGAAYKTGEFPNSLNDIDGNPILLPYIENVDNAPTHSNHFKQLELGADDVFDTGSDFSVHLWLAITNYGDGGQILTNGSLQITFDAVNINFTRDGITTATYAHNSLAFIYVAFISGGGLVDTWIGDLSSNPMLSDISVACGADTVGTLPMYKNNNHALSNRLNGYSGIAGMFTKLSTLEEIQQTYEATIQEIIEGSETYEDVFGDTFL